MHPCSSLTEVPVSVLKAVFLMVKAGLADSALGLLPPLLFGPNEWELEMWANAQRDGRPAEYRWRPLFSAAKFG